MVDPDGEFFAPVLISMGFGALMGGATYSMDKGLAGQWKGFLKAVGLGAMSGAITGGFAQLGGSLATNIAYGMLGQGANWAATTAISGGDLTGASFGGMLASGLVSGLIPGYTAQSNKIFVNIVAEVLYNTGKGAASGWAGALASGGNVGAGIKNGMNYGAASSLATIGLLGPAKQPLREAQNGLKQAEADFSAIGYGHGKYKPVYRGGGLFGLVHHAVFKSTGITIGRNLLTYEKSKWSTLHETMHYYQQFYQGIGSFYGQGIYEMLYLQAYLGIDPYELKFTNEGLAEKWTRYYFGNY